MRPLNLNEFKNTDKYLAGFFRHWKSSEHLYLCLRISGLSVM